MRLTLLLLLLSACGGVATEEEQQESAAVGRNDSVAIDVALPTVTITVTDRRNRPVRNACFHVRTSGVPLTVAPARPRYCTDRGGMVSLAVSGEVPGSATITAFTHRDLASAPIIIEPVLRPPVLSLPSPRMYRNECMQLIVDGGLPPYAYEILADDSRGGVDEFGNFCGGDGTNGGATIRVIDAANQVSNEVTILIFTPPPHPLYILVETEQREFHEGECIYLDAAGNGGEFWFQTAGPMDGYLADPWNRSTSYCFGPTIGTVVLRATDRDGLFDQITLEALGPQTEGE
mgnify:CR=1 FL=1